MLTMFKAIKGIQGSSDAEITWDEFIANEFKKHVSQLHKKKVTGCFVAMSPSQNDQLFR